MTKTRTSIIEALITRRREPDQMHRPDFKGERRRLTIRLTKRTIVDLEVIKVASGEDKNAFCERHLAQAVEERVTELREKHGSEAERLAREIRSLTTKGDAPVLNTADPQTDALAYLGRVLHLLPAEEKKEDQERKRAGYDLSLLMAIFIELGSGLGLYISTTPWRSRGSKAEAEDVPSPPLPAIINGVPLEAFAAECLERKQGQELYLAVAFEAYKDWSEQHNRPMLGRTRFDRGLLRLAKELGLDVDSGVSGWLIHDVRLRGGSQRRLLRSP